MLKLGSEDLTNHKAALWVSQPMLAQENGSRGTHFAKFLISNFLKGLTYSALSQVRLSRKNGGFIGVS